MESTIKQINRRIKGTEKFWDEGGDPMLQLVADRLGQTNATAQFWSRRRDRLIHASCYHQASKKNEPRHAPRLDDGTPRSARDGAATGRIARRCGRV
ncbi:MAG: hypothetical protein DCC68_24530 [Planctomycetota bacterium]|nr:MAG: hypothetical protein DCC68_24530 [Planctomycetota bacterium]